MIETISSKYICKIILEVLRLIDKRLIAHSERVAYIIWKMMECRGGYEEYEAAEYAFIAALHDIGAFKVERDRDMLDFDVAHPMKHSIYGYLFMKYISPIGDRAKILMYSHIDEPKLKDMEFEGKEICKFVNIAGRYDLFHNSLGEKFKANNLRAYEGKKYTPQDLDLLELALKKHEIEEKFKDMSYKDELDKLWEGLLFSDEEKQKYLNMLIYISGFHDEYNVINTMTSAMVSAEIASKIGVSGEEEMRELFLGSALHDIGMLTVPDEIVNAPRRLTPEEMATIRSHVATIEVVLQNRVSDNVLKIAVGHHERLDGSGYPHGWKVNEMSKSQKILQVADTITALTCERPYHPSKGKDAVCSILTDEMNHNKFDREVVTVFIDNYDEIMTVAKKRAEESLATFKELKERYEKVKSTLMPEK
ncbi:MAG: HD domain-containing protein [Lachnospiraceae bacterium]|nr:HD domain-containing protein [Lachnospiraceae bacterium]